MNAQPETPEDQRPAPQVPEYLKKAGKTNWEGLGCLVMLAAIALPIGGCIVHSENQRQILREQIKRDPITYLLQDKTKGYNPGCENNENDQYLNYARCQLTTEQIKALIIDGFKKVDATHYSWHDGVDLLPHGIARPEDVIKIFGEEHPELLLTNIGVLEIRTHVINKFGDRKAESMPKAYLLTVAAKPNERDGL